MTVESNTYTTPTHLLEAAPAFFTRVGWAHPIMETNETVVNQGK